MSGFTTRQLGKTNLQVSPIGIGGGSGLADEDLLYAFERGINYFFFSSDLHHFSYRKSAGAIRQLCQSGSSVRDKVVLATVSYLNNPEKIVSVLLDQFSELGVDYIDVFHWGWVTETDNAAALFEAANDLKDGGFLARVFREQVLVAQQVNQDLLDRGLVRFVGASFHSRHLARQWKTTLDVLMLRYNLGHLGVEMGVFPLLAGDKTIDPGLVAFNVAHEGPHLIAAPPPDLPPGMMVPTVPDCYRYALSNPYVDVVLAGLTSRREIDEAVAMLEKGPFSPEECEQLRAYGKLWRAARLAGQPQVNLARLIGV